MEMPLQKDDFPFGGRARTLWNRTKTRECKLPSSCFRNHTKVSSKSPSHILLYISSRQMGLVAPTPRLRRSNTILWSETLRLIRVGGQEQPSSHIMSIADQGFYYLPCD